VESPDLIDRPDPSFKAAVDVLNYLVAQKERGRREIPLRELRSKVEIEGESGDVWLKGCLKYYANKGAISELPVDCWSVDVDGPH
jgi:hypothetical protein